MKQYLLVSITKSPAKANYIRGPRYDLNRNQVKIIVNYFKLNSLWNYSYIVGSDGLIDNLVLFNELDILDPYVCENDYLYSLDFGDVNNYFTFDLPSKSNSFGHLSIISKKKNCEEIMFRTFLDQVYQLKYFESKLKYLTVPNQNKLGISDIELLKNDQFVNYMYEINFDKYDYYLDYANPWDFIIESDEDWFRFLPGN